MLTVFTLEQNEQWDAVVRSFKDYDIYWMSGYVKAFQIHGDGEPLLFYYEDKAVRGMNVVMKRDVASNSNFLGRIEKDKYTDFATPYGYGGWIIEGEDSMNLFESYLSWIKENNIISEFVRFHPMIKNHEACRGFYDVIQLGEVVHMKLSSQEDIWNNLTSKNRNVIRKAIKNDVKIYNGRFPEIYKSFKSVYDATMYMDDAEEYYYFSDKFYKSVLEDLAENAQVFWAVRDETVIAASIILECNGFMNYHLSGSVREFNSFAPTNLLLYKAALWGYSHGLKTLYLGGGVGAGKDSLFNFKKSFYKGELNHFYIGKKIYDFDKYNELVSITGQKESTYFPLYRAVGNLIEES